MTWHDLWMAMHRCILDILTGTLHDDAVERLNLNLPDGARERVRLLAKASNRTESEVARDLMMESLERRERAVLIERIRAAQTPEARARKAEIVGAVERLRRRG